MKKIKEAKKVVFVAMANLRHLRLVEKVLRSLNYEVAVFYMSEVLFNRLENYPLPELIIIGQELDRDMGCVKFFHKLEMLRIVKSPPILVFCYFSASAALARAIGRVDKFQVVTVNLESRGISRKIVKRVVQKILKNNGTNNADDLDKQKEGE